MKLGGCSWRDTAQLDQRCPGVFPQETRTGCLVVDLSVQDVYQYLVLKRKRDSEKQAFVSLGQAHAFVAQPQLVMGRTLPRRGLEAHEKSKTKIK